MTIEAKVILDSISEAGVRLTTFELTYPRFIHAELMTHRVFSRNAASSRAIPTPKKIERIRQDCARPSEWGINMKGMQASGPLDNYSAAMAAHYWDQACDDALFYAEALCGIRCATCFAPFQTHNGKTMCACIGPAKPIKLDLHKQVANRILEPFDHITVVLSTTKLKNHFKLRLEVGEDGRPKADPTYFELATKWKAAWDQSTPKLLEVGDWHLPYIDCYGVDLKAALEYLRGSGKSAILPEQVAILKKISTGRCARVSYMRQGQGDVAENVKLHDGLAAGGHWSPFEHVATPMGGFALATASENDLCQWCGGHMTQKCIRFNQVGEVCMRCAHGHIHSGNFHGWQQYRKEFDQEAGGD